MKFKKNKSYSYSDIEGYANDNDLNMDDIGANFIGENFIVLKDERNNVASFVLTGYNTSGIYECIYVD